MDYLAHLDNPGRDLICVEVFSGKQTLVTSFSFLVMKLVLEFPALVCKSHLKVAGSFLKLRVSWLQGAPWSTYRLKFIYTILYDEI